MLIAITGGSGTLATNLAKDLVAEGHTVKLLSRSTKHERTYLDGIEIQQCDYFSSDSVRKCVDGVKALIHCAGPNSLDCNAHFETEGAYSIKASENIAHACLNQSIPLVINFSTFLIHLYYYVH